MINQLKNKHQNQTCQIIGKGPSLKYLTEQHIDDGPIITINDAIISVQELNMLNKVYSLQKDGGIKRRGKTAGTLTADCDYRGQCGNHCGAMVRPKHAGLILHQHESRYCFEDYPERYVFSLQELDLKHNENSITCALMLAKYMGCDKVRLLCCDVHANGNMRRLKDGKNYPEYKKQVSKLLPYLQDWDYEFVTPGDIETVYTDVAVLIPVIREDRAQVAIDAVRKHCPGVEIVSEVDTQRIGCPAMVAQLLRKTDKQLIMFLGDDTRIHPGALRLAIEHMQNLPDGWGVVGLNTIPGNDHAHWLADRRMLEHIPGGEFFPLEYRHAWGDRELKDIAKELGRWAFADDALVAH